jgi:hypothetical protein
MFAGNLSLRQMAKRHYASPFRKCLWDQEKTAFLQVGAIDVFGGSFFAIFTRRQNGKNLGGRKD